MKPRPAHNPHANGYGPFQILLPGGRGPAELLVLITCTLLSVTPAGAFDDLATALRTMGFDPTVPGNAIVLFGSDVHMALQVDGLPAPMVTTNLDWRFVKAVNDMNPPPAKIVFCGDESSSLSPVPGTDGLQYPVAVAYATNEMRLFSESLAQLNYPRTNILWVPGNHDQSPTQEDAEFFQQMFPGMPPYQSFEVSEVKFILVNSGNFGQPGKSQTKWLTEQVASTSPTQTVVVVTHQPPFHGTVAHRGVRLLLKKLFADWPTRWWIIDGHEHSHGTEVFQVGRGNVVQETVGPVSTNTFVGFTYDVGCMFLCLSNGVAGRVYYHSINGDYEIEWSPNWDAPVPVVLPFENVKGLLWRRLKSHVVLPELVEKSCYDSYDWLAYPGTIQWKLDLSAHENQATHFLVLCDYLDPNSVISFSVDQEHWLDVPKSAPENSIYAFAIPPEIASAPAAYVRFVAPFLFNNWIGGWGLSSATATNLVTYPQMLPVADQTLMLGTTLTLGLGATDPYAPPDVLRFSLVSGPEGSILDQESGVFTWTPNTNDVGQSFEVVAKVDDGSFPEMSATNRFQVKVVPENYFPRIKLSVAEGRTVLDWDSKWQGYVLESSDSLQGPWQPTSTNPPVTIDLGQARQFFRLRSP